jgi:hypothetical protein
MNTPELELNIPLLVRTNCIVQDQVQYKPPLQDSDSVPGSVTDSVPDPNGIPPLVRTNCIAHYHDEDQDQDQDQYQYQDEYISIPVLMRSVCQVIEPTIIYDDYYEIKNKNNNYPGDKNYDLSFMKKKGYNNIYSK